MGSIAVLRNQIAGHLSSFKESRERTEAYQLEINQKVDFLLDQLTTVLAPLLAEEYDGIPLVAVEKTNIIPNLATVAGVNISAPTIKISIGRKAFFLEPSLDPDQQELSYSAGLECGAFYTDDNHIWVIKKPSHHGTWIISESTLTDFLAQAYLEL